MRDIFRNPVDFWAETFAVWRIFLAICVTQFVGLTLGTRLGSSGIPFLDLWCGGAAATPIGYALGLVWHLWGSGRRFEEHKQITVFMGVIAAAIGGAGLVLPSLVMA